MPERRRRTVPVPLRKLDYFERFMRSSETVIQTRGSRRPPVVAAPMDPTWSSGAISLCHRRNICRLYSTGAIANRGGEWKLIEWETALPSRTELECPEGLEEDILKARESTHALRSILATDRPSPRPRARDSHGSEAN